MNIFSFVFSVHFFIQLAQLETEIDLERARYQELLKDLRRNERRVKELLSQVDEEQTKVLSLTDTLSKANDKVRIYKSQIESAESSAVHGVFSFVNLPKPNVVFFCSSFVLVLTRARRLERELEDAEQRAEVVTTTLIRSRSVHRGD